LLLEELFSALPRESLKGVAVSDKPRPVEGSYMPVFLEGLAAAEALARDLSLPLYRFSHQEGHIAAIRNFAPLQGSEAFLCYHLSGGTTELLEVRKGRIEILGGSRDLSAGQLLDRVGVALGMNFPAGPELDRLGGRTEGISDSKTRLLTRVPVKGAWFHLSGIESQCQRLIASGAAGSSLVPELFERLADCLIRSIGEGSRASGLKQVLLAGGVSQSRTLRTLLEAGNPGLDLRFGEYGADNGIGVAVLGGIELWHQNR
jgi:N6-L-threonylcarbamoyladenine synthase